MMNAEELLPPGLGSGSLLRAEAAPFISNAAKEVAEEAMFLPWPSSSQEHADAATTAAAAAHVLSGGLPYAVMPMPWRGCDLPDTPQAEASALEMLPSPMRVFAELEPSTDCKTLALSQLSGSQPLRVARAEADNPFSEASTPVAGSNQASEELQPVMVSLWDRLPPAADAGSYPTEECCAPGIWATGGPRSSPSWNALKNSNANRRGTAALHRRGEVEGGEGEAMATVMQKLTWWDPAQVVVARRIMRLGFGSPALLREYYSYYGRVEAVFVVNSSTKCNSTVSTSSTGAASAAPVRCRPSGLGFVVMSSILEAEAALADGAEQIVNGVAIRVTRFERRRVQDGLVDPCDEREPLLVPAG